MTKRMSFKGRGAEEAREVKMFLYEDLHTNSEKTDFF